MGHVMIVREMESVHNMAGEIEDKEDGLTKSITSHDSYRQQQTYYTVGGENDDSRASNNMGNYATPHMEEKLRRRVKYFFMNPCQKWQAKGRLPWKLGIQLLKIIFLTVQLVMFSYYQFGLVKFDRDNKSSFRHLFLQNWDSDDDTPTYDQYHGTYAVYTVQDFNEHVDYTANHYLNVVDEAIGSYGFATASNDSTVPPPIQFCMNRYSTGNLIPFNDTLKVNTTSIIDCYDLWNPDYNETSFSIEEWLINNNQTVFWDRIINIQLKFSLKCIHLAALDYSFLPDCYRFDIVITFDNNGHNGKVSVGLQSSATYILCTASIVQEGFDYYHKIMLVLDIIVIIICFVSCVLCIRSLLRGMKLKTDTNRFFQQYYMKKLSWKDTVRFVDFWYVMIVSNDVLTILGSLLKIGIEPKLHRSYDLCSILLGLGVMLAWFGVLRYLTFFANYNILILTLKSAMPNVFRFCLCAAFIYFGFAFFGWAVLGPYHYKFQSLGIASEAMFSLINGDDMFATFEAMSTDSSLVWFFSRVYLYVFISLFIYVVLSLFIAVIMDTYENIKAAREGKCDLTELDHFMSQCTDCPESGKFRTETNRSPSTSCNLCCCFFSGTRFSSFGDTTTTVN